MFANEEIVFDYCTVEHGARDSDNHTVLEAVTSRRISDALLKVARRANLHLVGIEPAIVPIIKLIYDKLLAESVGASLLLALDCRSGSMCVFQKGVPKFCQNLSIGIKDILEEREGFDRLKDQMKPVLKFARSLAGSHQLLLRVTGSCNNDRLHEIGSYVEQTSDGVAVEQIDFIQIAKRFDIRNADNAGLPIFAFASALTALGVCEFDGQINLVSQESLAQQETQKEISLMAKAMVVVVLLSIAAIYPLRMKIAGVEASSAEIEGKIIETVPMKQKIAGLKEQIKQLKQKQSAYSLISQELIPTPWPQALRTIGDTVPHKVRIVDISMTDSGDITLIGEALAESDVYSFAKKLQDSRPIENAKVEEIEYDNSNAETIIDYKITCKIRLPEGDL